MPLQNWTRHSLISSTLTAFVQGSYRPITSLWFKDKNLTSCPALLKRHLRHRIISSRCSEGQSHWKDLPFLSCPRARASLPCSHFCFLLAKVLLDAFNQGCQALRGFVMHNAGSHQRRGAGMDIEGVMPALGWGNAISHGCAATTLMLVGTNTLLPAAM